MKKLPLPLIFACLFCFPLFAVDGFSTLQERMSSREFQQTGLEKLTVEELAALNEWLRSHSVATLDNATARKGTGGSLIAAGGDMRGFDNQQDDDSLGKVINGTIAGTFDGWAAKGNLFTLTNGMIWQQDEKDSFYVEPVENASITIEKGLFGRWYLSMVGHKSKVKVVRIQ